MVIVLVSGSSGPGLSTGWGHCVVFLGKTLYSHSAEILLVAACSRNSGLASHLALMQPSPLPFTKSVG